jgi:signal transduction histidine kinase
MVSMRSGKDSKHLGLGLYVARLIAEGHGGRIVANNVDGGVRFTVDLPRSTP